MIVCPAITSEKRKLMEKHIGYRHGVHWWSVETNRAKAKAFKIADYKGKETETNPTSTSAVPGMMMISKLHATPTNPYAHGVAKLMGFEVDAYFDLGGIKILLNDDRYDEICRKMKSGLLPDTEMVALHDMGYTSRGVPVDLACSTNEGSSVVWIKRWVRTTIAITTKTGRMHLLTRQVVGFVRRSTPLLIVGQEGCGLCGYKTIERQDEEHANREESNRHRQPQYLMNVKDSHYQPASKSQVKPSYPMIRASDLMLPQHTLPDKISEQRPIIPDGSIYVGALAHQHMELTKYIMSDRIEETIITTAVARRAGLRVDTIIPRNEDMCPIDEFVENKDPTAYRWIKGTSKPHATKWHNHETTVDKILILSIDGCPTG